MMKSKMPRYPARACATALAIFACVAASVASADTTYNYVGSPYTGGNHEKLGTNMTGSVTFNFDTTGFSGRFSNITGADAAPVIALQITAGPFTSTFPGGIYDWFITLDDGEITSWLIKANGSGPFGFNGPYPFNYSDFTGSSGLPLNGYDGFEQVHSFQTGDPLNVTGFVGFTSTPGQWFIVPAPAMGAGLPALALLLLATPGWLGWRRSSIQNRR
jgi:hypothetical protein